ncbi:hypothetical protein J7L33_06715 [Candidatus Bathyarchaeota archaeon]|nr:hypothetical protein [Candidatus Bathyarchaeota archaeon]
MSSEKSKREMADFLRKLLGVDIEFERLSKEDLVRLYNLFSQYTLLFLAKIYRKSLKDKVLENYPLLRKADILTGFLVRVMKR